MPGRRGRTGWVEERALNSLRSMRPLSPVMAPEAIMRCGLLPTGTQPVNELAVMVDTFYPLHLARQSLELEKKEYMATWLEGDGQ